MPAVLLSSHFLISWVKPTINKSSWEGAELSNASEAGPLGAGGTGEAIGALRAAGETFWSVVDLRSGPTPQQSTFRTLSESWNQLDLQCLLISTLRM